MASIIQTGATPTAKMVVKSNATITARRHSIATAEDEDEADASGHPVIKRRRRGTSPVGRPARATSAAAPFDPATQPRSVTIKGSEPPSPGAQPGHEGLPTEPLHGIGGLSKDAYGRVYWRGRVVDCLGRMSGERELATALSIAKRCLVLESKGFPVNASTLHNQRLYDAPDHSQWYRLLVSVHAVMYRNDQPQWLVLTASHHAAVALRHYPREGLKYKVYVSDSHHPASVMACRDLASQGLNYVGQHGHSMSMPYRELMLEVGRLGISHKEVDQVLDQTARTAVRPFAL